MQRNNLVYYLAFIDALKFRVVGYTTTIKCTPVQPEIMSIRHYEQLSQLEDAETPYMARFTAMVFYVRNNSGQIMLCVSDLTPNRLFKCPYHDTIFFGSFDETLDPESIMQVVVFPETWRLFTKQFEVITGHLPFDKSSQRTNVTKHGLFVEITATVKRYRDWIECVVSNSYKGTGIKLIHPNLGNVNLKERALAYKSIIEGFPRAFLFVERHVFDRTFGNDLFELVLDCLNDHRSIGPLFMLESPQLKQSSPPQLPTDDEFEADYDEPSQRKFRQLNGGTHTDILDNTGYIVSITNLNQLCTKSHRMALPKVNPMELVLVESMDLNDYGEVDLIRIRMDTMEFLDMDEVEELYINASSIQERLASLLGKVVTVPIKRYQVKIHGTRMLQGWKAHNIKLSSLLDPPGAISSPQAMQSDQ